MNWLRKIRPYLPQEIPGPMAVLYEKVATGALCGFYRQVASEVTSSLTSGRVLDVGTGPGHLLIEIARLNRDLELVGVDLSSKMLKIAESLIRQEVNTDVQGKGAGIRLVQGEVHNLLFLWHRESRLSLLGLCRSTPRPETRVAAGRRGLPEASVAALPCAASLEG